jgi:hypothetical protein
MFFIFGWMRRLTVLGIKLDECPTCGEVGKHIVSRKTHWAHLFWIPVVFLGFTHGMICSSCHTWTGIPWRQVKSAMKTGALPLDRTRPRASAALAAEALESSTPALKPAAVFDRLAVNPKRGPWDLYLKVWPVLVAVLLTGGALSPRPAAGGSTGTGTGTGTTTTTLTLYGPAHQCWEAADGSINGCRLFTGGTYGSAVGTPITCYFTEPLPAGGTTIRCD